MSEPKASTAHDGLVRVRSVGAGVQSTAMQLLSIEGILESDGFSIFSDTGWEHPEVYEHLEALERWTTRQGGPPIHRASRGNLRDDVLDPAVFATIPAWTRHGGVVDVPVAYGPCPTCDGFHLLSDDDDACADCGASGVVPVRWERRPSAATLGRIIRQCTPKYKVEPLEQKMRELLGARVWFEECRYCMGSGFRVAPWRSEKIEARCSICRGSGQRRRVGSIPPGIAVEQWIGFSTDEMERATTLGFPSWSTPRHPLLEIGWSRSRCIEWMDERGWKGVAKSACLGCPFHDDDTWLDIADRDPAVFAELVEYDRQIRHGDGLNAERFLHQSRLPLNEAVAQYRAIKADLGEQLYLMNEYRPKRKVRHCNPFGCRSEEMDDEVPVVVGRIA